MSSVASAIDNDRRLCIVSSRCYCYCYCCVGGFTFLKSYEIKSHINKEEIYKYIRYTCIYINIFVLIYIDYYSTHTHESIYMYRLYKEKNCTIYKSLYFSFISFMIYSDLVVLYL